MGVVLVSDSEDIKSKMIEMVSKCEELQVSLNNMLMKIEDSKGYFDTPTSLYFRDSATSYIIEQRGNISGQLVPFIEMLNQVTKGIEEEYEQEREMFNKLKGDLE